MCYRMEFIENCGNFLLADCNDYHLVIYHRHGKSQFLIGKPSINGPFPMAILNNQRVPLQVCIGKS